MSTRSNTLARTSAAIAAAKAKSRGATASSSSAASAGGAVRRPHSSSGARPSNVSTASIPTSPPSASVLSPSSATPISPPNLSRTISASSAAASSDLSAAIESQRNVEVADDTNTASLRKRRDTQPTTAVKPQLEDAAPSAAAIPSTPAPVAAPTPAASHESEAKVPTKVMPSVRKKVISAATPANRVAKSGNPASSPSGFIRASSPSHSADGTNTWPTLRPIDLLADLQSLAAKPAYSHNITSNNATAAIPAFSSTPSQLLQSWSDRSTNLLQMEQPLDEIEKLISKMSGEVEEFRRRTEERRTKQEQRKSQPEMHSHPAASHATPEQGVAC